MAICLPAPALVAATLALVTPAGGYATTRDVPSDFAAIQDAVDASAPGDTVAVHPGDYIESITVRDDLVILGSGAASTRIRGFSDATLTVDSLVTGTVIRGVTLRAAPGIVTTVYVGPGSAPGISDVVIDGGTIGLRAERSSPRIESSVIQACTIGVAADGSASPVFIDDAVTDNILGVSLSGGATPRFHECRFERNGIYNFQISSYSASAVIDASRNWWGTSDESELRTRIRLDGSGPVTLIYVPWCADPACATTPLRPTSWGALRTRLIIP